MSDTSFNIEQWRRKTIIYNTTRYIRIKNRDPFNKRAEVLAVKCLQRKCFPDDFEALTKNLPLPPKSSLLAFTPYLDEDGLICEGGKLRKAPLPEETRPPVILDPKSEVTCLVILHHHLKS